MAKNTGSYIEQLLKDGVEGLTELFNISPDRVDLVAFPAIGRRFLLVKANFSNKDWGNTRELDYTVDQLVRAVPAAVSDYAKLKAEEEGRDIIKSDLKLLYKEPDGSINVGGVEDAIGQLDKVDGLPPEVIEKAKKELDSVWNKIQLMKSNKEDNRMNDIVKSIEGYIGTIDSSGKNSSIMSQLKDILSGIKDNVQKGLVPADSVTGLLDELNAAFNGGKSVSKSFFANWSEKAEEFSKSFESSTEEDAAADDNADEGTVEKSESVEQTESTDKTAEATPETKVEGADAVSKSEAVSEDKTEPVATEVEKSVTEADKPADNAGSESEDVLKSIKAQLAKSQADLESAREDVRKANEEIQKARENEMKTLFISKAEAELNKIGKSASDMADILIRIKKSGVPQALFDEIYGLLKSANEMIDKSGFFDEKGTTSTDDSLDPDEVLMKSARDLVAKNEYPTVEQAYSALLKKDPSVLTKE